MGMTESDFTMELVKFQITNLKLQINPNDQNSKFKTCPRFGHWCLSFGYCLIFGAWNLVLYDVVLGIFRIQELYLAMPDALSDEIS